MIRNARMRSVLALALLLAAPACATLGLGSPGDRSRLWREAHGALHADSFAVAEAAFQRLAAEHPRSPEGREARYYLGVIEMTPDNPGMDLAAAAQHLSMFLALDSTFPDETRYRPEARRLLSVVTELRRPCAERRGAYQCVAPGPSTVVVERTVPGAPAPSGDAAEIARLRRALDERDETIRQLREEIQRIRNTLAPPPRRP